MKTWQAVSGILFIGGLFPYTILGQTSVFDQVNPLNPNATGLRLYGVSVSSSYFSQYYPGLFGGQAGYPLAVTSGSSSMLQASASFGWSKLTDKSNFSVTYSPSYVRGLQATNYHSINQSLGLSASRRLTSRWGLAASFQGLFTDFTQLLFAPTLYGNLTGTGSSFDEFASGILTGQSANPGLAQLLGAAPANGSPSTAFLYGGRELSASASVSLLYTQSTRSSFHFSVQGMRTQFLNAGSSGMNIGPATLIPSTTMGSATMGWSYSLNPRTTASVNVSSSRSVSIFEDGYATQATASIGRTLSTRWFVQAMAGAGYFMPSREKFATPNNGEPVFGFTVGYKFKAQTLLGSYTRTVSDSYGLGASATDSSNGAWTWNRPGSTIMLSGGFGYSRLTGPSFPNTTSWTANANFTKKLTPQLNISASYSYAQYPERVSLQAPNLALSGVMVGLSWSPSTRR